MEYLVIKDGDLFLLTDPLGNIDRESEKGLYTHDTRFLDQYQLTFNHQPLKLLNSSCHRDYTSVIHLTNHEEVNDGQLQLQRESVEVKREQVVRDGVFYERITFNNYARQDIEAHIELQFGSRFTDLFEARGAKRTARGTDMQPIVSERHVELGYDGLDNIERRLHVRSAEATKSSADKIEVDTILSPNAPFVLEVTMQPVVQNQGGTVTSFSSALQELETEYADWLAGGMQVETDNESFNQGILRGLIDLRALLTDLGQGPFPVAGIPWFAVPFGRDSLITAIQMLLFRPEVAKGTLRTLAVLQGQEVNAWRAEQPGKILHEMRRGEMANLDEIPFKRYYGSIDSTPLFLILAIEYYRITNDTELLQELLPNILKAVEWLDTYADVDGDGFVEYHVEGSKGLTVQSWKDSYDSMVRPDGELGESPMAVSEVQGYVYHAKMGLAEVLPALGHDELANRLAVEAGELKKRFNAEFWMEDKGYFAIALDKDKRQVPTVTSDPGHCLWSDIIDEEKIDTVVDKLLSPGLFSGWGIRTMSSEEPVYSPISYHNGSVWAHDNSMILLGFSKQNRADAVNTLSTALLKASQQFEYQRLPELFCGHDASLGSIVRYPVACNPQAWAAGTPLVVLRAILGLHIDMDAKRIVLMPTWPEFVSRIKVTNMQVGDERVSFEVDRFRGVTTQESNRFTIEVQAPGPLSSVSVS